MKLHHYLILMYPITENGSARMFANTVLRRTYHKRSLQGQLVCTIHI